MRSAPFVTSDKLLALAVTAERRGQRPSTLLGIVDPVLALEVDLAAKHTPPLATTFGVPEKAWDLSRDKCAASGWRGRGEARSHQRQTILSGASPAAETDVTRGEERRLKAGRQEVCPTRQPGRNPERAWRLAAGGLAIRRTPRVPLGNLSYKAGGCVRTGRGYFPNSTTRRSGNGPSYMTWRKRPEARRRFGSSNRAPISSGICTPLMRRP